MPYFSVIIPLYNKERCIRKTINSVLSQTFSDFEIVIVDDGSTDDSVGKVLSMNNPKIKIVHQQNSGVSVARNVGAKLALGKYLAFLDADDLWSSEHLAQTKKFFDKHPEIKWYSSMRAISDNENFTFSNTPKQRNCTKIVNYVSVGGVHSSSVVFAKDVFDNVQYPVGVQNLEDEIFYMGVSNLYPEKGMNFCATAVYIQTDCGLSSTQTIFSYRYAVERIIDLQKIGRQPRNYVLQFIFLMYLKNAVTIEPETELLQFVIKNWKYLGFLHTVNWSYMLVHFFICRSFMRIFFKTTQCLLKSNADKECEFKFFLAQFTVKNNYHRLTLIWQRKKSLGLVSTVACLCLLGHYLFRGAIEAVIVKLRIRRFREA